MANYQPSCGAVLNIVSSKAATLLEWLTKPMIQYHLQKLNQAGKATHSLLVQLPVTMTLNNSQSLAGHTSPIFTPDNRSKFKHPTHEMQKGLTQPKGKAPCRIFCWKGRYALLIWCRNHGMNTLPISLQTKTNSQQSGQWRKRYVKILINEFEPLWPFLSLLKWIDLSKNVFT